MDGRNGLGRSSKSVGDGDAGGLGSAIMLSQTYITLHLGDKMTKCHDANLTMDGAMKGVLTER